MTMLKGEIEILSSIALSRGKIKQIINSRIIRDNVYIMATVDSLVKRGFIQKIKSREYRLTPKGIRALMEFGNNRETLKRILQSQLLRHYTDRASEAVKMIKSLVYKYSVKTKEIKN
jgi:predicted transcriptional regulator